MRKPFLLVAAKVSDRELPAELLSQVYVIAAVAPRALVSTFLPSETFFLLSPLM